MTLHNGTPRADSDSSSSKSESNTSRRSCSDSAEPEYSSSSFSSFQKSSISSSSLAAWRSFSCLMRAAIAPPDLCLLDLCSTAAWRTGAGLNASDKFMHKATSWALKGARCLSFIKSTSRTPQATLLRNHVSASSNLLHCAWQHARLKAQSARSSETSLLPSVFASNLRALSKHSIASFHSSSSTWAMPCSHCSSNSLVSWAFFSSPLSFGFLGSSGVLEGAKSSSESCGGGLLGAKSSSESDMVYCGHRARCGPMYCGCCLQPRAVLRLLFAAARGFLAVRLSSRRCLLWAVGARAAAVSRQRLNSGCKILRADAFLHRCELARARCSSKSEW